MKNKSSILYPQLLSNSRKLQSTPTRGNSNRRYIQNHHEARDHVGLIFKRSKREIWEPMSGRGQRSEQFASPVQPSCLMWQKSPPENNGLKDFPEILFSKIINVDYFPVHMPKNIKCLCVCQDPLYAILLSLSPLFVVDTKTPYEYKVNA